MSSLAGRVMYKYFIDDCQLIVREGVIEPCDKHNYVMYEPGTPPDIFPGFRNVGRVLKEGSVLWLPERNDDLAKRLFTEFHVKRITDLQSEIDWSGEVIKKVRAGDFKTVSRCFGNISDELRADSSKYKRSKTDGTKECDRKVREGWDTSEFVDPVSYVSRKVTMLRNEMHIKVTDDELWHLKSLTTQTAIDNAVRSIINRHWV